MDKKKHALIFYHYFYPDDVISARHFADFAEELFKRGWHVSVLTSNRGCRKKIDSQSMRNGKE
jgi:colanic acid biosynthesis glycosyl transferase WcaI